MRRLSDADRAWCNAIARLFLNESRMQIEVHESLYESFRVAGLDMSLFRCSSRMPSAGSASEVILLRQNKEK